MRKISYAMLAASLAFGLTAAAAAGVAFTITSVQNVPGTASATATISTTDCDGTYAITWTIDQLTGQTTAASAERTPPTGETDPGLAFCANMPYALGITSGGTLIATAVGTTDASGEFTASTLSNSYVIKDSDTVTLFIGPDAYLI